MSVRPNCLILFSPRTKHRHQEVPPRRRTQIDTQIDNIVAAIPPALRSIGWCKRKKEGSIEETGCVAAMNTTKRPNITTSTVDRVSLAGTALDIAIGRLNAEGQFNGEGTGIAGYLYSQMAEFDIITNQTKYEKTLEQNLDFIQKTRANFSDPTYSFGHAAARAYTAYKNPIFLQYALQSWWFGRAYTLSESDVSAGEIATKNFSISGVCQTWNNIPETMVGGSFHDPTPTCCSSSWIAGTSTGYFLSLSALLAEATSDPLYLEAATQSANFISAHLFGPRPIVQEYILAGSDESCQVIPTTFPSMTPAASGLMIEGLSILYSITNNASTQSLLNELLMAVIPNIDWQGSNGVVAYQISSTETMGDMNLLQGLGAVYTRNSTTAALRQYVGTYIAVQFNAVIDLATTSGTNIYAGSWTGPPSADFLGYNQTAALAALLSAISLTMTSEADDAHPSKRAAILVGSLGVVAALTAVVALWFLRRYCIGTRSASLGGPSLESAINPFMETTPAGSSSTRLGPQIPVADDMHTPAWNPVEPMVQVVSDPAGLSRNTGAFFPHAQNFVIAGGHFTHNIINLPSPISSDELGTIQSQQGMVPIRRISSAGVSGRQSDIPGAVYQADENWRREFANYSGLQTD
ncbi:hypothetical protein B0H11DRAFT_2197345 [Mycena galericulata]|nr:hypothetical protein B0H11DRAFT_2197345 [Mycena galericulata]